MREGEIERECECDRERLRVCVLARERERIIVCGSRTKENIVSPVKRLRAIVLRVRTPLNGQDPILVSDVEKVLTAAV